MLIAAAILMVALAAVFKALQNIFFLAHAAMVVLTCYIMQGYSAGGALSAKAFVAAALVHLALVNVSTVLLYAFDKKSAVRKSWRVPEKTLHAFAVIGGTPAAIISQRIFRHKTRKGSFQATFWLIFILQIAAVVLAVSYLG